MTWFGFTAVYKNELGRFIYEESMWVKADTESEALSKIKKEYPGASNYIQIKLPFQND